MALTLHRPSGHAAPGPDAAQILRMATEHGAATTPFAGRIGRLAPGLPADIVLLDWDAVTRPWQDPVTPVADVLVRRARRDSVGNVIIGGAVVFHAGQFSTIAQAAVFEDMRRALDRPGRRPITRGAPCPPQPCRSCAISARTGSVTETNGFSL